GFIGVRPVPYRIPSDGPVGRMLQATGRHPWRPAHIHLIVRARGYRTLTTHIFDSTSEHLDADAVFAVKPSLLRAFVRRSADDPAAPPGIPGIGTRSKTIWCSPPARPGSRRTTAAPPERRGVHRIFTNSTRVSPGRDPWTR